MKAGRKIEEERGGEKYIECEKDRKREGENQREEVRQIDFSFLLAAVELQFANHTQNHTRKQVSSIANN